MFISFEGLDFCGKSTQISLLKNYLIQQDKKVMVIREPGGTNISEMIRDILLDKKNLEMNFKSELLLFAASRAQLVNEVIIPKLKEGYFVLSDRFSDSSIAYQGFGRGIDVEFVENLQNYVIEGAVPELTFFIDLSVEEVKKRKLKAGEGQLDRIERMDTQFFENVRKGYLSLAQSSSRFVRIDGAESIEIISEQIKDTVVKHIKN